MNTTAISRTIIVIILAIVIVVAAVSGGIFYYMSISSSPEPTITMSIWGGSWAQYVKDAMSGFEEAYHCKIVYYEESSSTTLLAKLKAEASSPTLDVVMMGCQQAALAISSGLVIPLNSSIVTNMADLYSSATISVNGSTYFVGNAFNFYGIAVNTDKISVSNITSWKWLWDSSLNPKKLGVPTLLKGGGGILVQSSYIWYGDQYHNALDESWAKVQELAPSIGVAWASESTAEGALTSGTVDALMCWPLWANNMIQSGAHIKFFVPQEHGNCYPDGAMVVKNGPCGNNTLAQECVNWLISAKAVSTYCAPTFTYPTNTKSSVPVANIEFMLSPDVIKSQAPADPQYYAQNIDNWTTTWNSLIKPLLS